LATTGVDKNIGLQSKYWGEEVAITDEIIGVSQLLGIRARVVPQSMAYFKRNLQLHKAWQLTN